MGRDAMKRNALDARVVAAVAAAGVVALSSGCRETKPAHPGEIYHPLPSNRPVVPVRAVPLRPPAHAVSDARLKRELVSFDRGLPAVAQPSNAR